MSLLTEYKNSLKLAEVEEWLDLFFYRPAAFLLVKAIYRLPITPNQVTGLSLIAGLVSGWCFAQGTVSWFFFAGIWYAVANVFDCADGMLARLQGSGTPFGRLVDGVADWAISVAIFVGVGIGLTTLTGNPSSWWLAAAGGLTSALHAIVFDSHQQSYIAAIRGKGNPIANELARARSVLNGDGHTSVWIGKRIALRLYLSYMTFQERLNIAQDDTPVIPVEQFRASNRKAMRWWTLVGPTTNRSGLIIAGLFGRPDVFCWVVAIPWSLYVLFMILWQKRIDRELERTHPQLSTSSSDPVDGVHRQSSMEPNYDQDSSR